MSLSALRLAVSSVFTLSKPEIIDGADDGVKKQRRRRLSGGAAEAASNRAELSARRRANR